MPAPAAAESKPSLSARFAHLVGLSKPAASAEPDPTEEPAPVPEAAPAAEPAPAPEAAPAPAPEAARAEENDDEPKRDDESDEDYDKRKKKSKKAKASDDSDEEMRGSSPVAQARDRERARCAAIFSHEAAARRPDVAASVAFDTRLSRSEAISVLTAAAAGAPSRTSSLAQRMAAEGNTPVVQAEAGGNADQNSPKARAAAAIAAADAVRNPAKK